MAANIIAEPSLFIDLSKALDTVDHGILGQRLLEISLSVRAVDWFSNYLLDRKQCVQLPALPVF